MTDDPSLSRRRFIQKLSLYGVAGLGGQLLLSGYGGTQKTTSEPSRIAAPQGGLAEVTIEPLGNQLKYKQTEFTVQPGQEVSLTFNNTATSPAMQHNVVVLNMPPKQEFFRKVGQAGMQAGPENEYVPDLPLVLAYTPIAKPGETVSVTFTAPEEPGEYGYVCTYPGHWVSMQGTMIFES